MEKKYNLLEWDSEFFGFKVAKIKGGKLLIEEAEDCLKQLAAEKVKLAYYNSETPLTNSVLSNEHYEIKLVHKRILLEKTLKNSPEISEKISFFQESTPDEKMVKLAQRAGSHGRFNADPNIPVEKYNELFKEWIINSVLGKMASEVLVYREDEEIVGLATIKLEEDFAYMPLFAVDEKFEGKGISFALLRAVETVALQRGYSKVLGGTQDINRKALKVYERYGIEVIGDEFIYHLWRK